MAISPSTISRLRCSTRAISTDPGPVTIPNSAARRISRLAVGDVTLKPVEEFYDADRDPVKGTRNERLSDTLPFDSRAGISLQHYFPVDGEYVFKIRIPGVPVGEVHQFASTSLQVT